MVEHLKRSSLKKAERLVPVATESIGRTAVSEAAETALMNLLMQYELIAVQRKLKALMAELLPRIPNTGKQLEIKGVRMMTAAVIISEISDC